MTGLSQLFFFRCYPPTRQPPKEDLRIAQLNPYWCITSPCYANPIIPATYSKPGWLSWGSSSRWRSKIQSQAPVSISAVPLGNIQSYFQGSGSDVARVDPPADATAIEAAVINPVRPTVRVTTAERDQFLVDRASILARYPTYTLGPESDPVFILTDAPGQVSTPTVVLEAKPPPLLGVVGAPQPSTVRDPVTAARTPQSNGRSREFGEQPMGWLESTLGFGASFLNAQQPSIYENIGLLGSATSATLPSVLGGIASQYFNQPATPPASTLPPYVNPTTQVSATNVTPITSRGIPVGCISQRDIDIAAAAGTSPEMVDLILKLGRRNRRRKRMLTKSDIGDISVMRQMLGNGEAFKLWLAKATR